MTINSTADDLIAEIEAAAKACGDMALDTAEAITAAESDAQIECPICHGNGYADLENEYCNFDNHAIGVQFYGIGPEFGAGERCFRAANPANVLALTAETRDLKRWKAEQLQVMGPVMDYAHSLKIAPLGNSVTKALIDDHAKQAARIAELEEAQRTQPASNPYLPHVIEALHHCEHTIHRLQADLPLSNRIYKYMNSARVQADRALKNYRRVEP